MVCLFLLVCFVVMHGNDKNGPHGVFQILAPWPVLHPWYLLMCH
jgi:hypothetical protein